LRMTKVMKSGNSSWKIHENPELAKLLEKFEEELRSLRSGNQELPAEKKLPGTALSLKTNGTSEENNHIRSSYEQLAVDLTDELTRINEVLILSRVAYLNMMEDLDESNRALREANIRLARQGKKNKKAKKRLKKSEKIFRTLLNSSPEAILKMDLDGKIEDLSRITPGIFGFEKKRELKKKSLLDFVLIGDRKRIQDEFMVLRSEGAIRNFETTLVKRDNSTFTAEISLNMVQNRNDKPVAYIAIVHDVSVKRKTDVQMIHNARLISLGEMATGIAHEINQPLNTISLTLDNILYEINQLETADKEYFKTKSEKIFNNIYRIRNIIEHIRDFSRYQDDHRLVPFDLHKSITDAVSLISEELKNKEIELQTDFETTESHVLGNVFKFEQVILNLLANSKDALEEKRHAIQDTTGLYIRIHTFSEKSFVFVALEDNGVGIKTGDADKVLLPFYTTKEEGKGTGLGLSISYGIIKEMGGTFEIKSKEGTGTTVLIKIPAVKYDPSANAEGRPEN
jgi:PAS domain S-box-containing protein